MHHYDNLKIYTLAMILADQILSLAPEVKRKLGYPIADQIQRSAISVPSNIAEGAGRNGNREFAQFIGIANGSLGELHTQLRLIHGRKIIDDQTFQSLETQILELQRMLRSFLKRLSG
jgi:four helix bundle protein